MKIVGTIFEKMIFFLLRELPLVLEIDRKRKKWAKNICRGILDIEYERDWPDGLGAMLGDEQKIKNYFSGFKDFSGKRR